MSLCCTAKTIRALAEKLRSVTRVLFRFRKIRGGVNKFVDIVS